MPDAKPARPPLEPLAPAVVGIGFAILVIGAVAWTLIPLLATSEPEDAPAVENTPLVWRAPASMAAPEVVPPPQAAPEKPVAPAETAPIPPAPVPAPQPLAAAPPPAPAAPIAPTAPAPAPAPAQTSEKPAVSEPLAGRPPTLAAVARTLATPPAIPVPPQPASTAPADTLGTATGLDGGFFRPLAGGIGAQLAGGPSPEAARRALAAAAAPPATPRTAPPPPPSPASTMRQAGKFISLSIDLPEQSKPAAPVRPMPSLLDIARGNEAGRQRAEITGGTDVSRAEQALQSALLAAWEPPSPTLVPVGRRSVIVRLALMKDGAVQDAAIQTPSGSPELDASVAAALKKIPRIPESLPAKFPSPRYPLRIHLQID